MDIDKLNKWADLLLDTGKKNNLINFKDTKMSTVEIIAPKFDVLFSKIESSSTLEVYDQKFDYDEDDEITDFDERNENITNDVIINCSNEIAEEEIENTSQNSEVLKKEFLDKYSNCIKNNQILIYNVNANNPINVLKNIKKRATTAIEEFGVNIAYMAFGFINWTENENSEYVMCAPILLVPISIENNSAIEPYHIKIADSEIVVNPTFSYKLKNDYGIELPNYDDEPINEYFEKVNQIILKLNWSISEECKISTFSFLKINMYKDLKDNAEEILKNKNIRSLLGKLDSDYQYGDNIDEKSINNITSQLHNVVDADSSQIAAIEMAKSGKSFVLQGPPGTGKSQTITNIIAECLACGKKVLFVSEKLAALNVVYDKLKKVELDEFCLELHSHKANKKTVINELCHTLKSEKKTLSKLAQKEIDEKVRKQELLDKYVNELHKKYPVINKSLYDLYEEISGCRNAPSLDFVINEIEKKGEEYIDEVENVLRQYVEYVSKIGYDYHKNYWFGYFNFDSSYQTKIQLKSDLNDSILLCENIKKLSSILYNKYSITVKNMYQAYSLKKFFYLVKTSEFITPLLLDYKSLMDTIDIVNKMSILSEDILSKKSIIDEAFDEDIYKLEGLPIYKKLNNIYNSFFSRIFSGEYKNIIKELKLCKKEGKKINYNVAISYMKNLIIYQQKINEFNDWEEKIKNKIGSVYVGVATNFSDLLSKLKELSIILSTNVDFADIKTFSNKEFISKKQEFSMISDCFEKDFNKIEEAEKRVFSKFDISEYDVHNVELNILFEKYQGCLNNIDKLDYWCEFVKVLRKLSELQLRTFIDLSISKMINTESIINTYKKAFYTQWSESIINNSPTLIKLTRIEHDEIVKTFKIKDKLLFDVNKAKIKAQLSMVRPNLDMTVPGSAISILLREGEKKRKQKSIRQLLEAIGDLAQILKPCFLMSPLSVSTFLNSNVKFDVVIFDEASQIFPQDAIGAIYRGNQLIVVGDSKQMPPSNFFSSSSQQIDDSEEEDDITDFESILDISSTVFKQIRLKWHYRSRFESLISFSNKNFYDRELITFPSSKQKVIGIGVDYFYVNGTFDRKSKTNRAEAEKIVDLVFENIEKYPERSLGVVAFSVAQQNLIDKFISKRRQLDPSKEFFFKSDKAEPFFVKNLETVQGDERDIIIFSIAYGRDSQGRFIMNFGPLNRDGGERRLNVAVTRAKINIQLVSSIHHTDIDLSRTQSIGTKLLKEYLDFAENGALALERTLSINQYDNYDSEFEMEVCEFLRENGFSIDTQVGCSSFKIDLALKHPNTSDYLLAIECDGASYHSSKCARDRDRLRQEILESMGWKFYRIWSTDWFRNKSIEKEKLLEVAKESIVNSKKKHKSSLIDNISFEEKAIEHHFEFPKYIKTDENKLAKKYGNDEFDVIRAMVDVESPLSEEWLLKRIVFLFGREKVTNVVREEYNYIMKNCTRYNILRKNGFLYSCEKEIPLLRVPNGETTKRDIKYISLEELSLGIKEILKQNISVEKNGLFNMIVQQLGFNRVGDAILDRLESSLKLISDEIVVNENRIFLKNNSDFNNLNNTR